jgi:hypothetical protein
MVTIDPAKIALRRREIGEEIARLQKEGEELDIVLRVLERMATTEKPDAIAMAGLVGESSHTTIDELSGRPGGTPTNFEMAELVLLGAEKEGRDGLTANELVEEIKRRYWPGLVGKQILPSIYQFAKKGRLRKTASGKFKRIKKQEGSEAAGPEPSGG